MRLPVLQGMRRTLLGIAATALGLLAFAPAAMSRESAAQTLTVKSSSYGRVLFDGRGYVLYAFTRDAKGRSACYTACAKAWPVYYASGTLRVGKGLERSLLGTTKRRDGRRQITYAGRPLYYYVGDRKPGQIRCQNVAEFGGTWLVVRPSGRLVR
jgi:predicted lipoprotein with Yx(FWY)xxD motif